MILTKQILCPILVDARKVAEAGLGYPVAEQELEALRLGDCVVIGTLNESFCVKLVIIKPNSFVGVVENHLYRERMIAWGDLVEFAPENIFQIC